MVTDEALREGSFDDLVKALCQRFEPDSWRKLYPAEFQMRRKRKMENWVEFGDDLCAMTNKAFLKLGAEGIQQMLCTKN